MAGTKHISSKAILGQKVVDCIDALIGVWPQKQVLCGSQRERRPVMGFVLRALSHRRGTPYFGKTRDGENCSSGHNENSPLALRYGFQTS